MLSEIIVELQDVWKKYSLHGMFHQSLREEIAHLFSWGKTRTEKDKSEFWALQGVHLQIKKGQCVGLYGPNGAGKSTILKLIANVTFPDQGAVIVKGRVAPLIEIGAGFHPDLTGRENVFVNGTIIGMSIAEVRRKMDEIIAFAELKKFIDLPIKKYSSGMYLRLGFSIAIHSDADIILLDEILAVGDIEFQNKCLNRINDMKEKGHTIIIVSHDQNKLKAVCDYIVNLKAGRTQTRPQMTYR